MPPRSPTPTTKISRRDAPVHGLRAVFQPTQHRIQRRRHLRVHPIGMRFADRAQIAQHALLPRDDALQKQIVRLIRPLRGILATQSRDVRADASEVFIPNLHMFFSFSIRIVSQII